MDHMLLVASGCERGGCSVLSRRFCLGEEGKSCLSWSRYTFGLQRCNGSGNARPCRVIRDERGNALASITGRKKEQVHVPSSGHYHWPRRERDQERDGTLWDERYSDDGREIGGVGGEVYKEEVSRASCLYGGDEDAVEEQEEETRVEASGGAFALRQWLPSLVESLDPRLRGIIMLNMLTFLCGSSIAVVKETESVLDPASFSVGRFAIAALVFAPFLRDAVRPGIARAGLELGVWASIGYLAQALGLMTTDAGRAAFFTTFTVLTVPFIAGLMGKKIPVLTWCAAVAALLGVGLLETTGAPPSVGDAWSLLSSVVFGIHLIRTEYHSRIVSPSAALPIISIQMSVITASSCMWSFASHVTAGDAILPNLDTLDWPGLYQTILSLPFGPMLYTGLFTTAFCLCAELVAMRHVSAIEAAVITTMEPLWGAATAWCVLGERWGLRGWVGAAFILGGSLATQIWGSPRTGPVKRIKVPLPTLEEQDSAQSLPLLIKPPVQHNLDGVDKHRSASRRRN